METISVSRVLSPYLGKVREVVYTTRVDDNNKQFVQQVVYYRNVDPSKGANVDVRV